MIRNGLKEGVKLVRGLLFLCGPSELRSNTKRKQLYCRSLKLSYGYDLLRQGSRNGDRTHGCA